jgi:PUA domain protein
MDDWGEPEKLVVVREEKKQRAIVVGLSTVSGAEAVAMTKGSCLKNLHYVGDRYWELHKKV